MSEPREIEAKFDFNRDDRDLLLSVTTVGRFIVREQRSAAQDDTYFDTADARLAQAGATLRVRQTAKGARMTYKGRREADAPEGEAHIASRLEDEVPLDAAQVSTVAIDRPMPAMFGVSPLDRARRVVGNTELRAVARLQNNRATLRLSDENGATLELMVDDCVGTRLSDGREIVFDEVELEAISANRAALMDASQALQALVPSLRPSPLTKLGRTLG